MSKCSYVSFRFIFSYIVLIQSQEAYSQIDADSSNTTQENRSFLFQPTLCGSYITYHNWEQGDHTTIALLSTLDFKHHKYLPTGWKHDYLVRAELGYLRFVDSIWIKNADQFKVNLQWNEKPGKFLTHSYSVLIQSQFLKSYQYYFDDDVLKKVLNGYFMAPGVVELGYGLNWYFWKKCRINTAFATLRISSKPRIEEKIIKDEELNEATFKSKKRYIKTEYGFGSQVYISKAIYQKTILWDNQSKFFFNAINKKNVHLDIANRFTLCFLKFMQFRIDTHFVYEPDYNTRIQYRNELLLGVFYEIKNKHK